MVKGATLKMGTIRGGTVTQTQTQPYTPPSIIYFEKQKKLLKLVDTLGVDHTDSSPSLFYFFLFVSLFPFSFRSFLFYTDMCVLVGDHGGSYRLKQAPCVGTR